MATLGTPLDIYVSSVTRALQQELLFSVAPKDVADLHAALRSENFTEFSFRIGFKPYRLLTTRPDGKHGLWLEDGTSAKDTAQKVKNLNAQFLALHSDMVRNILDGK